ncbi:MAG: hypothetical protein D6B25_12330 [Desulfobulbaceae bacterium]|nr:MAG: hypothetical protein D6B25_12330 [Desulfobulbaceae bacterium]
MALTVNPNSQLSNNQPGKTQADPAQQNNNGPSSVERTTGDQTVSDNVELSGKKTGSGVEAKAAALNEPLDIKGADELLQKTLKGILNEAPRAVDSQANQPTNSVLDLLSD